MQATLFRHADCKAQPLGNGVTRRVLAYDEKLMFAEVCCEAGGSGPVHSHPHAQNTYVLSGRFLFTAGEDSFEMGPGDSVAIPPDVPHGTRCLEAGAMLDVFTPMRTDFL